MAGNIDAIREFYDEVWVYGDPAVYDPIRAYGFPRVVADRTHYVGYLDQRARFASASDPWEELAARLDLPPGRLAVCVVGGGQDGGALAEAFARADRPPDTNGLIVTGPFMPAVLGDRLRRIAAGKPGLRVLGFVPEPLWLLNRADRIVAMGGYNSVCEILSLGKPALIVPRSTPRREQTIRAERLRDLGLVDVLGGESLTPERISEWLAREPPGNAARYPIDLNGLARVAARLERLLAPPTGVRPGISAMPGAAYVR